MPTDPTTIPGYSTWLSRLPTLAATYAPVLAALNPILLSDGTSNPANTTSLNSHLNHDGLLTALRGLDAHPGDTGLISYRDQNLRLYRDGYVIPSGGTAQAPYNLAEGLSLHWQRTGDAASKTALGLLRDHAAYVPSSSEDLTNERFSREVAYALDTFVEAERVGFEAMDATRFAYLMTCALNHCARWVDPALPWRTDGQGTFIQPFMMGLTCMALIKVQEYQESKGQTPDARIVPAVTSVCNWLWSVPRDPATNRFPLHYFAPQDATLQAADWAADGNGPVNVLNNLFSPPFAWLYHRTGDAAWAAKGDAIFAAGVGSNDVFYPKQVNELYRYSPDYVAWRTADPLATPTPTPTPTATGPVFVCLARQDGTLPDIILSFVPRTP